MHSQSAMAHPCVMTCNICSSRGTAAAKIAHVLFELLMERACLNSCCRNCSRAGRRSSTAVHWPVMAPPICMGCVSTSRTPAWQAYVMLTMRDESWKMLPEAFCMPSSTCRQHQPQLRVTKCCTAALPAHCGALKFLTIGKIYCIIICCFKVQRECAPVQFPRKSY